MSIAISKYKKRLDAIFRRHKVQRAYLFGSSLRKDFNKNSDLDFLIKFHDSLKDPVEKGEMWWNLHDSLRDLFRREVDLITENSLKNPYFIEELEENKKLIYGS
ncbi:nucleotidyltransferase family protein [Sinomicrobium soli]|uniref:nucleotidyltransferase family protein n=1 Tax=Sinomicrobium sp. N-1-3-6 TaxID=2219864 RepID=UPI000DCF313E|nr:nucleotidyltransferase domain-containing protein [Sinomicrobium sp. N-1-3-6]RAV30038.1 hypothetical protein DN748_04350 [Sinomicrobium sp. N-1-3-6]